MDRMDASTLEVVDMSRNGGCKTTIRAECMKVVACITCFQAARLPHLHFMRGRRFLFRLV